AKVIAEDLRGSQYVDPRDQFCDVFGDLLPGGKADHATTYQVAESQIALHVGHGGATSAEGAERQVSQRVREADVDWAGEVQLPFLRREFWCAVGDKVIKPCPISDPVGRQAFERTFEGVVGVGPRIEVATGAGEAEQVVKCT